VKVFPHLCQDMRTVSISQLWSRAWDLFKVNWLLLLGLLVLYVIVSFIPFIGGLIAVILLLPALVRAGYLVARQGQSSFGEAFGDLSSLLMICLQLDSVANSRDLDWGGVYAGAGLCYSSS
jgi:hypothetical protein